MNKLTKKSKTAFLVFTALSILCNILPLSVYTITALCGDSLASEKFCLCTTVLIVLIMSVVAFINKTTMKSKIWILLLGLYVCLDHFITPLLIIAVCQIIDEWVACPLKKHYHTKYTINKEMDKRVP